MVRMTPPIPNHSLSEFNLKNFLSVTEFAKYKGVSSQRIRKLIQNKQIWAEKVGKQWIIGKNQEWR